MLNKYLRDVHYLSIFKQKYLFLKLPTTIYQYSLHNNLQMPPFNSHSN